VPERAADHFTSRFLDVRLVAAVLALASRSRAVLPTSSSTLRVSNQIPWAPRQTFRELRRRLVFMNM
jgi:hypothetical protein